MNFNFFAYLNRMKYIKRWSLMHSMVEENIMEHTEQVSVIAHALAVIKNKLYGGSVNVEKVLLYSQYHETSEVITGDLPTPIKYYNKQIIGAYKEIENKANRKLLAMLPRELQSEYESCVIPDVDSDEYKIMKCADKISAYIKCEEEVKLGNSEFIKAKDSIYKDIMQTDRQEVLYFMQNVAPCYSLTLDELESE